MTAHHNILRAASSRAVAAAVTASKHAATNHVADTISDQAVDAALATLPDAAEKGARLDPGLHNGYFLLASWTPGDRRATALYEAVARRLDTLSVRSRFETVRKFFADLPYELYVSFDDVHAVATRETRRRETWLAELGEAWLARAGTGAEVKVTTVGATEQETVVLTAPEGNLADPMDRRPAHLRVLEHRTPYDADKPVPAVVAEAVAALHLPAWTFEAVLDAWRAKSRGGDVVRSRGQWRGTAVRQVATMIFRGPAGIGHGAEVTFAVDEVAALSAAEIAERAYRDFTAAAFEAQTKAREPHAAVPVPPPAPNAAPEARPRGARSGLGEGTRFGAQPPPPVQLDVPFTDPARAGAEAKALFPRSIAIPGGVVRVLQNPEEGVAFRVQTEVDGAVLVSATADDATEGADTLALLVEDAWKEAGEKQAPAGEDSAKAEAPAAEAKPAKGAPKGSAGASKGAAR